MKYQNSTLNKLNRVMLHEEKDSKKINNYYLSNINLLSIFNLLIIVLLSVFSLVLSLYFVSAADPGHGASVIGSGTFESGNYNFPANLNVTLNFTVGNGIFFVNNITGRIGIGSLIPLSAFFINSSSGAGAFFIQNTSGSNLLFVNGTTGNIGIGTTSPGYLFHVNGADVFDNQFSITRATRGDFRLSIDSSGAGYLISNNSGGFYFRNGLSDQVRIDGSGNVGIGTTSPTHTLNVVGTSNFTGNLTVDTDTLYVDIDNNRVGIGNLTPDTPLVVQAGSGALATFRGTVTGQYIRLTNTATNPTWGFEFVEGSSARGYITRTSDDRFSIWAGDGSTEDFVVLDSGNVGIGTTSPTSLLHVNITSSSSVNIANNSQLLFLINGTTGKTFITGDTQINGSGLDALEVNVDSGGDSGILVRNSQSAGGGAPAAVVYVYNNDSVGGGLFVAPSSYTAVQQIASRLALLSGSRGINIMATSANSDIRFYAGSLALSGLKMSINSSGNVGIGITAATSLLHVNGTTGEGLLNVANNSNSFLFVNGSSGNVGIGTSNPLYPLTVQAAGNATNITIWVSGNVSSTGYITRTYAWDKERYGKALDALKDSKQLRKEDGSINHSAFGNAYVKYPIKNKVGKKKVGEKIEIDGRKTDIEEDVFEEREEEGVLLDALVAKHEQALYELKEEIEKLKADGIGGAGNVTRITEQNGSVIIALG